MFRSRWVAYRDERWWVGSCLEFARERDVPDAVGGFVVVAGGDAAALPEVSRADRTQRVDPSVGRPRDDDHHDDRVHE
jgi:hypothetical protein